MRAGELPAALHSQTPQAQGLTSLPLPACALALPMQVAAEQGGQAQSSCTKDTPADEPATCQKQEPSQGLLDGPVQSSEQEQGLGTRRGAGWSWATPPLGWWWGGKAGACPSPAQALTYTSLSPTGIPDLAQAPARQPRPTHVRRQALRALCSALCCSFITEEWE